MAKPIVLRLECSPVEASGISSSTTTYSIAPATKARVYGNIGMINDASITTMSPPIGSTAPLRLPIMNDRHLLLPSARIGIEMIAPSGMFCMAMPSDIAMADASDIVDTPSSAPANTTPTAIPSGRLCIVTAIASMAVRVIRERGPSGLDVPK